MKDAGFTLQEQQTTKTQVLLVIIVCLKISGLLFGQVGTQRFHLTF